MYVRTIQYLKYRQIIFQVNYLIKKLFSFKLATYPKYKNSEVNNLDPEFIPKFVKTEGDNRSEFSFLNMSYIFKANVDWNFSAFGKLWNYNLQYLDYLFDNSSSIEDRFEILKDISNWILDSKLILEPYPVSIRIVNTILFVSKNKIVDKTIHQALCVQIHYLESNIEYHIDGNHLLENAIALRTAAQYLREKQLEIKSMNLLRQGLSEQILNDGAHYERSPMYHAILCSRLLGLYGIMNSDCADKSFVLDNLKSMSCWLYTITRSGTIFPCLQDSTIGIAPDLDVLFAELKLAGIELVTKALGDSNYRIFELEEFFCIINVGEMSPAFQPGHAHADVLSFVLYRNEIPLIVDPGISTYEKNQHRELERSTFMHNTVILNQKNQSEIWAGFRVGQRAKCKIIEDDTESIEAEIYNFAGQNWKHKRSIEITENKIRILDSTICPDEIEQTAYLHFYYNAVLEVDKESGKLISVNSTKIEFKHAIAIKLEDYEQSLGFNKLHTAKCVKINFRNRLETEFYV